MNKEQIIKERLSFIFGGAILCTIAFGLGRESMKSKIFKASYNGYVTGFTSGITAAENMFNGGEVVEFDDVKAKAVKYAKGE